MDGGRGASLAALREDAFVLDFVLLRLEFVSDFVLRISGTTPGNRHPPVAELSDLAAWGGGPSGKLS